MWLHSQGQLARNPPPRAGPTPELHGLHWPPPSWGSSEAGNPTGSTTTGSPRATASEAASQDPDPTTTGEHDFSAFRARGCQARHAIRTIHRLEVEREGDRVSIDIEANAFLYHMVRNIAGVLMAIGRGIAPPVWARQVLDGRRRSLAGVTAPASGLYLTDVRYPAAWGIPAPSAVPPAFAGCSGRGEPPLRWPAPRGVAL